MRSSMASPQKILIQLTAEQGRGRLADQGRREGHYGRAANTQGMGLHIMNYRAGMIGGSLEIRRDTRQGTIVTCTFPVKEGE